MENIRNRATDSFPTVLLTLLSIVQALALELLWENLHDRADLNELTWPALVSWLQIAASLSGLILIWLVYAGLVMRFRWTPSTGDSIMPFFIGLIEFLMIDMLGPGNFGQWIIVLAVVFATMVGVSHHIMRRARLDPANDEFFEKYSPATARDFTAHSIIVVAMTGVGAWLWLGGDQLWLAFTGVIGILVVLARETWSAATFWAESMGER